MLINSFISKLRGVESREEMIARVKARIEKSKASAVTTPVDDEVRPYEQLNDRLYYVTENSLSIEDFKNLK